MNLVYFKYPNVLLIINQMVNPLPPPVESFVITLRDNFVVTLRSTNVVAKQYV